MNKEAKILVVVGLVIIIGGWALVKYSPKTSVFVPPADAGKIVREGAHMTGNKDAKVTLVEFGDYQCPACGASFPVIEKIQETYKDNPNYNFVFRNFPLSQHPYAQPAAEAAEAAGAQGKYWEMYRMLYSKQNEWIGPQAKDKFAEYAESLGLDVTKFRQALDQHQFTDIVKTDLADGEALKVNSTPTFFLNDEMMAGMPNFDSLKAKIDEKLK